MLVTYFSLAHALAYVSEPLLTPGSQLLSRDSRDTIEKLIHVPAKNTGKKAPASIENRLIHREIKNGMPDSVFNSEFNEDLMADNLQSFQAIEREKVKTDIEDVKDVLSKEMEELSPETNGKIASAIKSSNIDRNKYRDIFLIKKRVISDGDRKIVSFDIKERIIPKIGGYSLNKDPLTKILFVCILILLLSLVLTTTIKLYQTVVADRFNIRLGSLPGENKLSK